MPDPPRLVQGCHELTDEGGEFGTPVLTEVDLSI